LHQQTTLPNGLTILTVPMPGVETAAIGLHLDVGSRHEPARVNGVAHMIEHMVFKGTQRRSAKRIAEEIEDVGGQLNAYTARDTTVFHARVLADDVPLAVDMISDLVCAPVLDAAELEKEREVVRQELGEARDTPDDIIHDHLQAVAYAGQPIGRSVLGEEASIAAIGADDLRGWLERHYTGGAAVLVGAGKVEHGALVDLAGKHLGDLPGGQREAAEPARFTGGTHAQGRKLEQAHLTMGWAGPAHGDPDHMAVQLFTCAVGGGMSSRLFQELREERGLAYSVWANHQPFTDTGLFSVYLATAPKHARDAQALTHDVLAATAAGLEEAELARAKAQLKAGLLMNLESSAGWADYAARQFLVHRRVRAPADIVAKMEAVTLEQVRDAAARMLARALASATIGMKRAA
jgi:predicted Zn-dependent peptidase